MTGMVTIYDRGQRERRCRDRFCRAFRAAREERGLTLRDVGERVDATHTSVYTFEHTEKGLPSAALTKRVAWAVGIPVETARKLWTDAKAEEGVERARRRAEDAWS